jgi:hypothetical protein
MPRNTTLLLIRFGNRKRRYFLAQSSIKDETVNESSLLLGVACTRIQKTAHWNYKNEVTTQSITILMSFMIK